MKHRGNKTDSVVASVETSLGEVGIFLCEINCTRSSGAINLTKAVAASCYWQRAACNVDLFRVMLTARWMSVTTYIH